MPAVHGHVADCPERGSPEWAAQKEFALLKLVHIVALPPCASTLALMAAKLVDGTAP